MEADGGSSTYWADKAAYAKHQHQTGYWTTPEIDCAYSYGGFTKTFADRVIRDVSLRKYFMTIQPQV